MKLPFARFFERFSGDTSKEPAERRSQQWRLSQLESWAQMGLGSGPTAAGIVVTPERAVTVPAVYASLSVLAQDIAKTPIKIRRKVSEDTFIDATDHDLWEILHALPNAETTAFAFKHQLMLDLLTHERAYAEIVRVDGRVAALWRLDPTRVHVDRDEQRRKRYRVALPNGQTVTWLFDASRPPIFELSHPSPIHRCKELIGIALALQTYVGSFFANGARLAGVLQTDHSLSEQATRSLRDSFNNLFQGPDQAHKTAVLEEGLRYVPFAAPNSDAQLNETLQSIRTEIAATFRLPPWKVGDLSKSTYSNMESGAIEYATGTLDPYFMLWEHAVRRDLLTTRQFGQFDVSFDRASLIRSDVKSLHEALATGRQNGFYSANDIRRALGLNPISAADGGDEYLVNGSMTPATKAGRKDTPNVA